MGFFSVPDFLFHYFIPNLTSQLLLYEEQSWEEEGGCACIGKWCRCGTGASTGALQKALIWMGLLSVVAGFVPSWFVGAWHGCSRHFCVSEGCEVSQFCSSADCGCPVFA